MKAETIVSGAVTSMISLNYSVACPVILSICISRVSFTRHFPGIQEPREENKKTNKNKKLKPAGDQFLYHSLKVGLASSVGLAEYLTNIHRSGGQRLTIILRKRAENH